VSGKEADLALGDFLELTWLPAIERTIRYSTFASYSGHVRNHLVPRLGEHPLGSLSGPLLNEFYRSLLDPGSGGPGLSPTTVRRVHATLHRALRDAVRWGLTEINAADQSDPPRATSEALNEMSTWTACEVSTFLAAVKKDDLYPLWHLLAMTGLRRGEALGLRCNDVEPANRRLVVRQTWIEVGARCYISKPKTARGRRVVALDAGTSKILRRHVLLHMRRHAGSEWLFTDEDGLPLKPREVTRSFRQLVRGAGLPKIRLHDLRHTHATLALEAGVHPKIISERLGHSTVAFTLDVYSHAVAHLQAEAAEEIAQAVLRYGAGASGVALPQRTQQDEE
jgi:integrase